MSRLAFFSSPEDPLLHFLLPTLCELLLMSKREARYVSDGDLNMLYGQRVLGLWLDLIALFDLLLLLRRFGVGGVLTNPLTTFAGGRQCMADVEMSGSCRFRTLMPSHSLTRMFLVAIYDVCSSVYDYLSGRMLRSLFVTRTVSRLSDQHYFHQAARRVEPHALILEIESLETIQP